MLTLANNRSFRGTLASRMAADTRAAEAAPGWTGVGADYAAWLRVLRGNPTNPDSVITDSAPERAYLVVMNGGDHGRINNNQIMVALVNGSGNKNMKNKNGLSLVNVDDFGGWRRNCNDQRVMETKI
jgi:hypothetical protein